MNKDTLMVPLKRRHSRRFVLASGAAGIGLAMLALRGRSHADQSASATPAVVTIIQFNDDGVRQQSVQKPKVVKTDAEWQKQLTPDSYTVTRQAGTEAPFTGPLLNEHGKGVFRCICCDNAVYNANTKFESGTGWPSFWAPIAEENVTKTEDNSFGMTRIAISCTLCDAHLGHVFDDGPQPTGLRYCMNSVALRFAKANA